MKIKWHTNNLQYTCSIHVLSSSFAFPSHFSLLWFQLYYWEHILRCAHHKTTCLLSAVSPGNGKHNKFKTCFYVMSALFFFLWKPKSVSFNYTTYSSKEVMFWSVSVGLLVGWFVSKTAQKLVDIHKTRTETASQPRIDPITFWCGSW